jgi:hypothetical protein
MQLKETSNSCLSHACTSNVKDIAELIFPHMINITYNVLH